MAALAVVVWQCVVARPSAIPDYRKPANAPPPNVVLVLIDTLRADRLGCYGNQRELTPNLDALAADGVLFENAVAPSPWTQPSVAALFTGKYPGSIIPVGDFRLTFDSVRRGAKAVRVLQEEQTTMAEAFQAAGYATAAINTNVYIVREYGFEQGFDHFDAHWPPGFVSEATSGDVVNDVAFDRLDQRDPSKPFFLYLHYMDVHGPYNAAPEFLDPLLEEVDRMPDRRPMTDRDLALLDPRYLARLPKQYTDLPRHQRLWRSFEYWEARYDACVAEMDHLLGDLTNRLQRAGLWEDLVFVVTADHGEALGEHGHFGHGWSVRHSELHVPLIMRSPGVLPAGKRVSELVRLIDLMPTLLDHLRLPLVDGVQGTSLLPLLGGGRSIPPLTALAEGLKTRRIEQSALYRGDWKIERQVSPPIRLLYDIATDPLETTNRLKDRPGLFDELAARADRQRRENAALAAGGKRDAVIVSEEQLRRLRSLGYAGGQRDPTTRATEDEK